MAEGGQMPGTRLVRSAVVTVLGLVSLGSAAACGGGSGSGNGATSTTVTSGPRTEATIVVEGESYTCEDVLDVSTCPDNFQEAFDRWGRNLDAFVNSRSLGPFNSETEFAYAEVATAGFTACLVIDVGGDENDFIDAMLKAHPDLARVEFLPVWFSAGRTLCPQ